MVEVDGDSNLKSIIQHIVLKNAFEHDGKPRVDVVISRLIAVKPEMRSKIKEIIPVIKKIVEEISYMTLIEKKKLFENLFPLFEKEKEKEDTKKTVHFPPLVNAKIGLVVTRFPPEPNGYPHIGHAKAVIIDEEYAKMYNGKLILRFDDTNPTNEKLEYYKAILDGLEWLNIKPDLIKNTSDDIEIIYKYGKELVLKKNAYVCICVQNKIKENRFLQQECDCRVNQDNYPERIDHFFDGNFNENQAVVRFKGDMKSQNTSMRDPTLFRIINHTHPLLGDKYNIWPTYDLAAPIEDSLDGVTHAMRTKEYELRNELYFEILDKLSLRKPEMIEFSRLEFEGLPVSKRKIKPLIENDIITRWDDPRLPTLIGLKRRGFTAEAVRKFILSLGITLAETKPSFEILESFNRKIVDSDSIRLFFVKNPCKLFINNNEAEKILLKNHPNNDSLGSREIHVNNIFYIADDDFNKIKKGDEIRLMELYNIKIDKIDDKEKILTAFMTDREIRRDIPKIQWVSDGGCVDYSILVPDILFKNEKFNEDSLVTLTGFCESHINLLEPDDRIQFVRMGFCRVDDASTAIMTHK
ncbi:MAG: glutamate--tRNA ligase [Nitrososphaeraceae archaeon]|nr:glutamate--tRNA ligase [Nitrososphaeraceae archaeon]